MQCFPLPLGSSVGRGYVTEYNPAPPPPSHPLCSLSRAACLRAVGVEEQLEVGRGPYPDLPPDHGEQGRQGGVFYDGVRPWSR